VEQSAARPETTGTVIWPVQAVTEDIFYLDSETTEQCELLTAPSRNILTYLLIMLLSPTFCLTWLFFTDYAKLGRIPQAVSHKGLQS